MLTFYCAIADQVKDQTTREQATKLNIIFNLIGFFSKTVTFQK